MHRHFNIGMTGCADVTARHSLKSTLLNGIFLIVYCVQDIQVGIFKHNYEWHA